MKRRGRSALVIALALTGVACGDDGDGGAGGTASTASTSSTGGATKTGTGATTGTTSASATSTTTATASSASDASSSSTGAMCPDIDCTNDCPDGFWPELDTCPSCVCQAALSFVRAESPHDPQHVTVAATASPFIGGIDRWTLGLTWTFDIPQGADDKEVLTTTVRLPVMDLMTEPGATNEMRVYEAAGQDALEIMDGHWTLFGFGIIEDDLTPTGGFVSIRRNGMIFEGFASLDFESSDGPAKYHVGGPFTAQIPPI